jgi:hypothetical protein
VLDFFARCVKKIKQIYTVRDLKVSQRLLCILPLSGDVTPCFILRKNFVDVSEEINSNLRTNLHVSLKHPHFNMLCDVNPRCKKFPCQESSPRCHLKENLQIVAR